VNPSPRLSVDEYAALLPSLCDVETTLDPAKWRAENPLWGHCALATLIGWELFGGEMLRASLAGVPGFGPRDSHYWNRLPDGTVVDFTQSQFRTYPTLPEPVLRTRDYVIFGPPEADEKLRAVFRNTRRRYTLLRWRLEERLASGNGLFLDERYKKCFFEAHESPCQKMRFGCLAESKHSSWRATYHNQPLPILKHVCEPTCVRLGIRSRTEQMLGACLHAEEMALDDLRGRPTDHYRFFIAGFHADGRPYFKDAAEHTCLRCSLQLYRAGANEINVPVRDHWEAVTGEQAVLSAYAYACGEKRA